MVSVRLGAVIPVDGKLKKEGQEFQIILSFIVRPCFKQIDKDSST